jgi:hypothetical protein
MNTQTIVSCSRAVKLGPGINPISTQLRTTRLSGGHFRGKFASRGCKSLITGIKESLCVYAVQGEKRRGIEKNYILETEIMIFNAGVIKVK